MEKDLKLFTGRNIITYDPDRFSREDAIQHFLFIRRTQLINIKKDDLIRIDLDHNHKHNLYYSDNTHDFYFRRSFNFLLNGSQDKIKKKKFTQNRSVIFKKEIIRIRLSTPFLNSDKRWDSVGLTASPLFIGSALTENSFDVSAENISLPISEGTHFSGDIDLWGFTLFEDIFTEFKEFLTDNPPDPEIIIAAGGPLVTLNPFSTMFHLPEINLFIRGEGELVFPKILNSIKRGDLYDLFKHTGFMFQNRGLILISGYNEINSTDNLEKLNFHFSFSGKKELTNGLEMNFSRGCRNNCVFCSKLQGREFRNLPLINIRQLLLSFKERLKELNLDPVKSGVININDDDILQDNEYADSVFNEIVKNDLSIYGIQSSITSFFNKKGEIKSDTIKLISNNDLYLNSRPLLWTGTDTFLKSRGIRLGKPLPDLDNLNKLLDRFEKYEIENYHYWISSDQMSTWSEFFDELIIIYGLKLKFPRFSILPHSPFLIPYPSTPVYKLITRSETFASQLKYRKIYKGIDPVFELKLVDRVETLYGHLNRLLKNEKLPGRDGFFDYLKVGDLYNAIISAYSFLKEERISVESFKHSDLQSDLLKTERKVVNFITKIT